MSIQTELDRIIGLVHESHEKAQAKGGATTTPLLANLPGVIESIPQGVELPSLTNPGSASDLLSGKQLIDADGNVVTGNIATKTASNLSASGATVTVPAGYYASQATKSVATAAQATPSVSIDSAGKITASATQTAGYVAAGTKTGTKQLTVQGAKTITPTKSSQTAVASGRYTTGDVNVAAIPSSYIQPSGTLSVTANGTHDVKNYASVNVNVAGSGGGSVETCNVTFSVSGGTCYYVDGDTLELKTTSTNSKTIKIPKNSIISMSSWNSLVSSSGSCSQLFHYLEYAAYYISGNCSFSFSDEPT